MDPVAYNDIGVVSVELSRQTRAEVSIPKPKSLDRFSTKVHFCSSPIVVK